MSEYDPRELPILAELEDQFARMVADAYGLRRADLAGAGGAAREDALGRPVPAPARRRRLPVATGRRILGRAALAGALAGAVGATALATRSVVGRDPASARPVVLERAAGHELTLRRYQGRPCLDLADPGGVASRCWPAPAATGIAPLSAATSGGRVVAGLTGSGVTSVRVQIGTRVRDVATRAAPGPGAARHLRWFASAFPAVPRGRAAAATVTPRPAGATVADCSLGGVASCRAARLRAARDGRP